MKGKLIVAFIVAMLTSCFRLPDSNLMGKYVNTYEKDVEHYVILREDSTYYHYYKKEGEDAKVNEGVFSETKIGILFFNWISYGNDWMKPFLYDEFRHELVCDYDEWDLNFKKVDE